MTVVLQDAIKEEDESDAREGFDVFENLLVVVIVPNPRFITCRNPH
jgi:hypothetical protein